MDAMVFVDQYNCEIFKFHGDNVKGDWKSLELNDDEKIVGVKANMCEKYIRGIGFYVWQKGMGMPRQVEPQQI